MILRRLPAFLPQYNNILELVPACLYKAQGDSDQDGNSGRLHTVPPARPPVKILKKKAGTSADDPLFLREMKSVLV